MQIIKENKDERINLKISTEEYNKIHQKAMLYTNGNISAWIRYAAINCIPEGEDLEE